MSTKISSLSDIHPRAQLGDEVEVGPFCRIGPHVTLGARTKLDSNVVIIGHTTIGEDNRFFPGAVIGCEPQDSSYRESETQVVIGNKNTFREGVTVNRGAEKEDHATRIGDNNLLMSNSHVAHNCHVFNNTYLVNGVLLGGHVHVHDGAIVSGNSVVHHFSTLGTLSFISGGCRVPHDIPPYMLSAGSDDPKVRTINIVGMQRHGISRETIAVIKRAHRLIFRKHKSPEAVREIFAQEPDGAFPYELTNLLDFLDRQREGNMGRAREGLRDDPAKKIQQKDQTQQRRAA